MIPIRDDNPSYSVPVVTIVILVLNVLVYLFQISLSPQVLEQVYLGGGAIPARFWGTWSGSAGSLPLPAWATPFTSMFLHGGFWHLLGNMWFLWLFGDNVEDYIGKVRFVVFYLTCGLIGLGLQVLISPQSDIPIIGASGAIAGVLGAYLVLYPRAMVHTLVWFFFFVRVVRVPAVVFLGLWFFIQFVQGVGAGAGQPGQGGVAWFAHIGGFVAGVVLIRLFIRGRPHPSLARGASPRRADRSGYL